MKNSFAFLSALLVVPIFTPARADQGSRLRFNRDIRPILSENCFHCHGPDEENREAGLRLDVRDAAHEYAVVPGDVEASELIARIESEDPDSVMPPPGSERALTPAEIDSLRRWIEQGGAYQSHWSLVAPTRPPAPEKSAGTIIDAFVDEAIDRAGLTPSPPADRAVLLRRATFDLTGLPPTKEDVERFADDRSPDALEKALDRLLADPRYGERMASDWLDVARYSDTYGYQVDRDRFVWPWRDWVIDAFNRNLPYDRFLTHQLAGDLLPDDSSATAARDRVLATTFNRLHPQKVEGGSVPEEFRIEYVADRVQTVATGVMGLTYECCRCHNHKYDPITQREYFQLAAFFDNIDEAGLYSFFTDSVPTPTLSLPTDDQERRLSELENQIAAAERTETAACETTVDPIFSVDFDDDVAAPNRSVPGVSGQAIRLTGDDPYKTDVGNFRRSDPFSISLWIKLSDDTPTDRAVVLHRSRAWTDAASRGYEMLIDEGRLRWSLIHFWPGNAISLRTADRLPIGRWVHVVVTNDGSSRAAGLSIHVDGRRSDTTVLRDELTKQITGGGGDTIALGQRFRDRGFKNGAIDQLAVYEGVLTDEAAANLHRNPSGRRAEVESIATTLRTLRLDRDRLLDDVDEIMVMRELDKPRQTFVLARGAYDQPTQRVDPGTPACLPAMDDSLPRNRLGLARWLTASDAADRHPLTARVAVNRLWQICFGVGLVRTPEDFGSQGAPPTHPELLDHLAVEFIEHGWDVKRMLKRIMSTDVYRRSSNPATAEVVRSDPTNELLARFPAGRLTAEMLRDQALMISGRLVNLIGGAPVKPYEVEFSFKPAKSDVGDKLYRRSVYTYWKRTGPAPEMLTLDAAKRDVCRPQRERTSSPLQALVLLNGPQYVEAARGMAEETLARNIDAATSDDARILADVYQTLTSRRVDDDRLKILLKLLNRQRKLFRDAPESAREHLTIGKSPPREHQDSVEVAAWTVVIGTLMNFDPCVMKR